MSDIIHLLPDSVANQIAAGEVIQRPASVLKELVENSIDAGADFIQILIKDAGRTLIQITDNGKGMSETDARMSFERHATSKIQSAEDLFALRTMGFRGEALASIAAVAQVELRTRREDDELGTLIEIAGTRVFRQEAVQCNKGTTFQIRNLFFNVPARRRFLKSDNVEKSHLLNEFYRIALVNPEIEFSFFDGDDEIFHLPASNHKIRIESIFGKSQKKKIQQQLLTIETSTNLISIHGYVGKPEFAQKNANQYFFVNGRYMRHPYFHKAVMMAYGQMIQPTENPNYFIYFEVDPQTIDINIHPTKTEIKFENEQAIWSIISATVKEALGKFNIIPSIDFDQEGAIDIPAGTVDPAKIKPPVSSFNPNYNPFNSSSYKRPSFDWEKLYGSFESSKQGGEKNVFGDKPELNDPDIAVTPFDSGISDTEPVQQTIETDDQRSANFQLKNRYIITSVKSGMMMIDQHRAHVRILFEEFLREIEQQHAPSQQVLFPEELELSHDDALYFEQIIQNLNSVGFEFFRSETNIYQIKGVPSSCNSGSVIELLHALIEKKRNTAIETTTAIHEQIALTLAENSALKNGQGLTQEEMADLIDRLFACSDSNHTPDGKTIITIFSIEEIQAKFR
ncbi:MAG: DNA mismatch repair endonuclease MutL [Paludibacter sp.]|nr:DNA mismatch repair endonuclease MutL [Paludibacter sp.]